MTDIDDLIKPGAVIPVDVQTTQALVHAVRKLKDENKRLRNALSYCAQDPREVSPMAQAQFMIARSALAVTNAPDSKPSRP